MEQGIQYGILAVADDTPGLLRLPFLPVDFVEKSGRMR
jgi:hypothetical protein